MLEKNIKIDYISFFIMVMLVLIAFFCLNFTIAPNGNQANVFFVKTGNYMADFYNVAKASADNNPYFSDFKGSYFPVSYLLMYMLSRFSDYAVSSGFDAFHGTMGLASASFFLFVISAFFILILTSQLNECSVKKYFFAVIFMLSGIFLFSFERGNLILFSAQLSTIFIFKYKSSNIIYKEIALLSLAFAAALKGYPAILGMLLIYDRNYKDGLKLLLYGLLFAFIPFIFIKGGFTNIPQWYLNVKTANLSYLYGFQGDRFSRFGYYYFLPYWHKLPVIGALVPKETLHMVLSPLMRFLSLFALGLGFTEKTPWKKIAMLVSILILLPVNSALYCGLYMFPVIVLFFNEKKRTQNDFLYMILFILLLNPLQVESGIINFTTIFTNLSVFVIFFSIMIEQLGKLIAANRKHSLIKENI